MKTLTLTISQFNTFVKNIFDAEEFLHNISVFGEVTNVKISGGNAYFDLKDQNALARCILVGDRCYDAEGANIVGIDSLGALWGHGTREEFEQSGFTMLAKDTREVLELLI